MRLQLAALLAVPFLAIACGGETMQGADSPSEEPTASTSVDGGEALPSDGRLSQEDLDDQDMIAARAAVTESVRARLGPMWEEVAPTPDEGSDCKSFNPDLSRFTITGKARSAMMTDAGARLEFSVKIYANAGQASDVFELSTGFRDLRCIRDGVAKDLRAAGVSPRVVRADLLHEPAVGADTVIYVLEYTYEHPETNKPWRFPVEVFVFRTGRGVGAGFFSYVGQMEDELRLARIVESGLRGV